LIEFLSKAGLAKVEVHSFRFVGCIGYKTFENRQDLSEGIFNPPVMMGSAERSILFLDCPRDSTMIKVRTRGRALIGYVRVNDIQINGW
jgi:hypothetical protein